MALQAIIFLLLGAVILVLVVINGFLLWYFYQTNKKIDKLLEKGRIKDFKDIFLSQKDKNNDLEEKIKEAFAKIKNLEDTCETAIQKIGIVRFNPFNNMGGNQSFCIAMLDNRNNGFVISSFFVKEGNRVYAKAIRNGKSDHLLSEEEKEAIARAVGSKK
jgi:cell division protein FtsB